METNDVSEIAFEDQAAPDPKPAGKRRAVPRERRLEYLRDWEASGLSAEAFASDRPIKAQSLYRWRRRERAGGPAVAQAPSGGFRELKLAGLPPPSSGRPEATLRRAGIELTVSGCDMAALLPQLLRALRGEAGDV